MQCLCIYFFIVCTMDSSHVTNWDAPFQTSLAPNVMFYRGMDASVPANLRNVPRLDGGRGMENVSDFLENRIPESQAPASFCPIYKSLWFGYLSPVLTPSVEFAPHDRSSASMSAPGPENECSGSHFCCLFNDAVSNSDYTSSNDTVLGAKWTGIDF